MSKFELTQEFKSLVLKKIELKNLLNLFNKIVEEDNLDQAFKRDLDLSIQHRNDLSFESSNIEEFLNFLEEGRTIERMRIEYLGHNVIFAFKIYKNLKPELTIKTIGNKGHLMELSDDIKKIVKHDSWNYFFHTNPSAFWLPIITTLILFLVTLIYHFDKKLAGLMILIGPLIAMAIHSIGGKVYPIFVLEGENSRSGRIFKKDLKWIVLFIIGSIILPAALHKIGLT